MNILMYKQKPAKYVMVQSTQQPKYASKRPTYTQI